MSLSTSRPPQLRLRIAEAGRRFHKFFLDGEKDSLNHQPMQGLLQDLVRGLGWGVLKVVTAGRYKSTGSGAELFEGTVGLLVLAGASWIAYRWLS